jgi:hypothetical protein
MLRSVLAVGAGLAATIVLGFAAMAILLVATYGIPLGMEPITPRWPFLAANLAVTAIAGAVGGWLAASIGGRRPVIHAVAVGLLLMALVGPSVRPRPREPVWFAHALLAMALAGIVAGAVVRAARPPRAGATGSPRA